MIPGKCSGCGDEIRVRVEAGKFVGPPCRCRSVSPGVSPIIRKEKGGSAGAVPETPVARPKFNNKPTDCDCGRRHPSKVQARVCSRLRREMTSEARLYHDVRFPLLSIAPTDRGLSNTINVDFVIVDARGPSCMRVVDAKSGKRRSRDWPLRAAAFGTTYGTRIEEVDS